MADEQPEIVPDEQPESAPEERPRFNPAEHLIGLRGRGGTSDYLPVTWRIMWFRSEYPHGQIRTWKESIHSLGDTTEAIFKCRVRDGKGGEAWGYGSETAKDFGDYIEKAETKAIGRALISLGYGTAGATEMDLVDGRGIIHPDESGVETGRARSQVSTPNWEARVQAEVARDDTRVVPKGPKFDGPSPKQLSWAADLIANAGMTDEEQATWYRELSNGRSSSLNTLDRREVGKIISRLDRRTESGPKGESGSA